MKNNNDTLKIQPKQHFTQIVHKQITIRQVTSGSSIQACSTVSEKASNGIFLMVTEFIE